MSDKSIDILLATCNGRKYLNEQIDSILAQSNQDWMLLVRDDASDDGTINIIQDYVAKYPDRIKLIENDGCRLGACLNFQRLLENSNAEYIMFCDQDDVWLPKKIEATFDLMKAAEKTLPDKPILVHSDLKVVDYRLKTIADSMWRYQGNLPLNGNKVSSVMLQNVATGCTIMINKKAKTVSTPIPPEAIMHDWWIAINVAKHGKIVYLTDQLVLYRQHSNNTVGAKNSLFSLKKRVTAHYKMIKKYDPNARFWPVLARKTANKLIQKIICIFSR
ncbi:MAG: glycosyltransferase family 2 protein [Sedimentisphaerales bacterium]|nr:glycosyltransferase family 2 protein [Sedimentisphaerales bacterium]